MKTNNLNDLTYAEKLLTLQQKYIDVMVDFTDAIRFIKEFDIFLIECHGRANTIAGMTERDKAMVQQAIALIYTAYRKELSSRSFVQDKSTRT